MWIPLSGVVIADGVLQNNGHFERHGIHLHVSVEVYSLYLQAKKLQRIYTWTFTTSIFLAACPLSCVNSFHLCPCHCKKLQKHMYLGFQNMWTLLSCCIGLQKCECWCIMVTSCKHNHWTKSPLSMLLRPADGFYCPWVLLLSYVLRFVTEVSLQMQQTNQVDKHLTSYFVKRSAKMSRFELHIIGQHNRSLVLLHFSFLVLRRKNYITL